MMGKPKPPKMGKDKSKGIVAAIAEPGQATTTTTTGVAENTSGSSTAPDPAKDMPPPAPAVSTAVSAADSATATEIFVEQPASEMELHANPMLTKKSNMNSPDVSPKLA
jgi:hypothetical protein